MRYLIFFAVSLLPFPLYASGLDGSSYKYSDYPDYSDSGLSWHLGNPDYTYGNPLQACVAFAESTGQSYYFEDVLYTRVVTEFYPTGSDYYCKVDRRPGHGISASTRTIKSVGSAPLYPYVPDTSDFDSECEAIKPDFLTLPEHLAPIGESFTWEYDGCSFTTNSLWLQWPSGDYYAAVSSAEALIVEPPATAPVDLPSGGTDISDSLVPTSDPSLDCPWSNVTYDGQSYCLYGEYESVGASYTDGSSRIDHWDGSYTVDDGQGNITTYNPDGSLANPDTAPTAPGAGPGGSATTGENDGCPPWAPEWMCTGDGEGSGVDDEDIELPTESFDFATDAIDWDSGLATTMVCPAPMSISLPIISQPLEISYQPFCDLASSLRALVIAFAYLSAAFLVFRGLT